MDKKFYSWLGNRLKVLRDGKNLSRAEVGKAIGVSESVVQNWEIGRTKINADDLFKLSQLYKVSLDDIVNQNVINKDYRDIFDELLDLFDKEQIYRRFYSLNESSKGIIRIVLEQQEELNNLRNNTQYIPEDENTLIAASGAENFDEEEMKLLREDVEMVRHLGEDD